MRSQLYNTRPLTEERFSKIVRQDGRLAQLGEHRPYKARVTGSSPVASTTFLFKHLASNLCSNIKHEKVCGTPVGHLWGASGVFVGLLWDNRK